MSLNMYITIQSSMSMMGLPQNGLMKGARTQVVKVVKMNQKYKQELPVG